MPRAKAKQTASEQPENSNRQTRELAADLATDCFRTMSDGKGPAAGKKLLALVMFWETYLREGSAGLQLALGETDREAAPRWHA